MDLTKQKFREKRHRDFGISILQFAERLGSELLRKYKPEAFPYQYIYGDPHLAATLQNEDEKGVIVVDDDSVQVVADPHPPRVQMDAQSISSAKPKGLRRSS